MSHDQRPGKMRVVRDAARPVGTRRSDPPGTVLPGGVPAGAAGGTELTTRSEVPAASGALPLLPAAIFLLACLAGGVAVALFRPF